MARRKRQYGSGCLIDEGERRLAIRWREVEIGPDGKKRRVLRYEALGKIPKKQAAAILAARVAEASRRRGPSRSLVPFGNVARQWEDTVLPMYRHSTQKNHRNILHKHLLPRFGQTPLAELDRQQRLRRPPCSRDRSPGLRCWPSGGATQRIRPTKR